MANNLFQTVQSNSKCFCCGFHITMFPCRIWVNTSSSVWSAWWRIIVAVSIGTVCWWTVAPLHGMSIIKPRMFNYKHRGQYWDILMAMLRIYEVLHYYRQFVNVDIFFAEVAKQNTLFLLCYSYWANSYNQCINQKMHLIKHNSWQVSHSYMFQHWGANPQGVLIKVTYSSTTHSH